MMKGCGGKDKEERGARPLAILSEDFEGRRVRHLRHADTWWFAVEDVAATLTEGAGPGRRLASVERAGREET